MQQEFRLEDYVVRGLVDFDDIFSTTSTPTLLYDLAAQLWGILKSYLSEEDTRNVLIYYQKQLAAFVHAQMQDHQWEKAVGYQVKVNKGFTDLKEPTFTQKEGEPIMTFDRRLPRKARSPKCFSVVSSDALTRFKNFNPMPSESLAVILDRESQKWLKPAKGQFLIFYKAGIEDPEYIPDFVAETDGLDLHA